MPRDKVNGRLPPVLIQAVVRRSFGWFRLCYEEGLRRNPKLDGLIRVRFVIDRAGAVQLAKDEGSTLPDPKVVDCVVEGFGKLSFPPPDGGLVTVVYPIRFDPGDEADAGAEGGTK